MRNDRNVMVNFKPGEYMRKMYILTLRLFETLVVCHICKSTVWNSIESFLFFPPPFLGSKGCVVRVGESIRLPKMWPGFKSQRRRLTWVRVCCWFSPLLREVLRFSPLPSKTNTSVQIPIRSGMADTFKRVHKNPLVLRG